MFARLFERFGSYVCGGLLVALAVTSVGWYVTDARLDACTAGRKADKAAYEKAQSDAEVLHLKAIRKKEQEYEDKAKKADEAYGDLVGRYNDSLRLYASAKGKASATVASTQSGSASSNNRPGENTEFLEVTEVVVPVGDLAICAENTARLVIARDWALGLNTE